MSDTPDRSIPLRLLAALPIALLWAGAGWLAMLLGDQPLPEVRLFDSDLRMDRRGDDAMLVKPEAPMKMLGLRRNMDLTVDMELANGAEVDVVLARVQSTLVDAEDGETAQMVHFRERFQVLRLSTIRAGKALLTREEALFPGGDLPDQVDPFSGFHGGHLVAPDERVTVQVQHVGRVLRVTAGGKRYPDTVVPDEFGAYALIARGGELRVKRQIVLPALNAGEPARGWIAALMAGIGGLLAGLLGRLPGQLLGAGIVVAVPAGLAAMLTPDLLPLTRLDPHGHLAAVLGAVPLGLAGAATGRLKGPMKLVPVLLGTIAGITALLSSVELQRPRLAWTPEDPRLELYFGSADFANSELLEALTQEIRTGGREVLRLPKPEPESKDEGEDAPKQNTPPRTPLVVFLGGADLWAEDPRNRGKQLCEQVGMELRRKGTVTKPASLALQGPWTQQQCWHYRGFLRGHKPAAVVLALRPWDLDADGPGDARQRLDAWRQVVGENGVVPADALPMWGAMDWPEVPPGPPADKDQLAAEIQALAKDVAEDGGRLVLFMTSDCGPDVQAAGQLAAELAGVPLVISKAPNERAAVLAEVLAVELGK